MDTKEFERLKSGDEVIFTKTASIMDDNEKFDKDKIGKIYIFKEFTDWNDSHECICMDNNGADLFFFAEEIEMSTNKTDILSEEK